ncbi:uncharacterized protein C7orf57 homolog isoform X2 [Cynoglossus semilaevis]|uniref:uncharacterized protein C7orf57 homolog isoform X2 n=1 Tax=Cynoglossus semilaevis TaxID=244447 RepID=UPI0007DCB399|nr:uncharacterized protein C7orf57 homolog isoform X2 [Cynoglossus semilaevis]
MNLQKPAEGPMNDDGQPAKNGYSSVISQIPGLSSTLRSLPEEKSQGRRFRVLDSDSEYVKLAKQGGHKGLLWHEDTPASSPAEYRPPDWFCPAEEDTRRPRVSNSDEKKNSGGFHQLEPPFGTDNMSAWERGDDSGSSEKNNNHVSGPSTDKSQQGTPEFSPESGKYKRIVYDKRPAPVNMSKLLSFGYADDKSSSNGQGTYRKL